MSMFRTIVIGSDRSISDSGRNADHNDEQYIDNDTNDDKHIDSDAKDDGTRLETTLVSSVLI